MKLLEKVQLLDLDYLIKILGTSSSYITNVRHVLYVEFWSCRMQLRFKTIDEMINKLHYLLFELHSTRSGKIHSTNKTGLNFSSEHRLLF
jgi:hypothetical protein